MWHVPWSGALEPGADDVSYSEGLTVRLEALDKGAKGGISATEVWPACMFVGFSLPFASQVDVRLPKGFRSVLGQATPDLCLWCLATNSVKRFPHCR